MNIPQAPVSRALFNQRIKVARIGDPQAQYDVGLMYAKGNGIDRDVNEALVWFKSAAQKGHHNAQYILGVAYASGVGTEKDELEAVQWIFKAADQGNEKALLALAKRLDADHEAIAFRCCLKAATRGLADAQFKTAQAYAKGICVGKDEQLALDWYEKAAAQGFARAQFELAALLERAAGEAGDCEDAIDLYRKSAKQGHSGAELALARLDSAGKGRSKSISKRRKRMAGGRERRHTDTRWTRFAEQGDADDRYALGLMYESGIGVEKDPEQARLWYLKAAGQQHVEAQVAVARLCASTDAGASFHWWQEAALQGNAEAQYSLGGLYATGIGTAVDFVKSVLWQARAADQGHPQALLDLGILLASGDENVAGRYISRAAEQGHAQAQYELGERYTTGNGVQASHDQAHYWLELAAKQGNADAQCALGAWYADGLGGAKDFGVAKEWYEEAVQQGHPRAQWLLGGLYATGAAGVAQDIKQATVLCKDAATGGFAPAQAMLGLLFARAKKMNRAVEWWAKAAGQGDAEAQFNLANAYRTGAGVKADLRVAFLLMSKAAVAGIPAAQTRLGLAYTSGEGTASDTVEATKWFLIAAHGGDATAAANCRHARSLLSPVQFAEAQWRAEEWLAGKKADQSAGKGK